MTTTAGDVETAVRVLTIAFADDPVARWLLTGAPDRIFRPVVEASAAAGELTVSPDGAATAVWLPRPAGPPAPEEQPLPDELARLGTFLALTEARHPADEEHLHLVFLGVLPAARGRGLASALLRDRLARADVSGLPAHLEASSARNLPLYERHGFRATGAPIPLPDGPPVWPMWRPARPRTHSPGGAP